MFNFAAGKISRTWQVLAYLLVTPLLLDGRRHPSKRCGGPSRTRTCNQEIHLIPLFPIGVDYLFTRECVFY